MKKLNLGLLLALPFLFFACSSGEQKTEEASEDTMEATEMDGSEETVEQEMVGALAELSADQSVYFVQPEDGAEITGPVVVEFGVEGMEVEPAGAMAKDKGHHHVIINGSFVPKIEVVPANETNIHYGKGQLSDTLNLEPGNYTLTMQFADGLHQSYGEQMSQTISVTVK